MRLLFIRHGDPDYSIDSLTEKGCEEAKALAPVIVKEMEPGRIYLSPLGRAQKTASYALELMESMGRRPEAETFSWLREFPALMNPMELEELKKASPQAKLEDGTYRKIYLWDFMPSYCFAHPELMDPVKWRESDVVKHSDMIPVYEDVKAGFDGLLRKYGYRNMGNGLYQVETESTATLTFFCHFGITGVLLSILWGCSPFLLLNQLCCLPTSVTEVVTEEREQGAARFRTLRIGDLSHLALTGQEASFAARFREVYSDETHRN